MKIVTVSTSQERGRRRRTTFLAALAALLVGACAAGALLVAFTVYDDPCPGYEDEGTMAAPGSPYSRIMCEPAVTVDLVPMSELTVPGAVLASTAAALLLAALVVWRRPRLGRRQTALGVAGVLLVQPLLVLALQYALPRDCLSGRAETGECGRDRELR